MNSIEEIIYVNKLLDSYGCLLNSKQFLIMCDYYKDDLSLQEIADNLKITKAAVSDSIRRSRNKLIEYEKKLQIIVRKEKIIKLIKEKDLSNEQLLESVLNTYSE